MANSVERIVIKNIRLRQGKSGRIRPGYPWVFKKQLLKSDSSIRPGDIVSVLGSDGKFVGRGYYNPRSDISIRILSFSDEPIDTSFFENRIQKALEKREGIYSSRAGLNLPYYKGMTNAYRAVFSEADALPGLIVDLYGDTAVFQILTLGMEKFKSIVVEGIKKIIKPRYIYEKSTSPFRKIEGLKDEAKWWSDKGSALVWISEGNARFLVDIVNGHKTGFYLDQRNSRMALRDISKDRTVLDLFCYTGAFAVSACLSGAKKCAGVDIKEEWLELARENAKLNGVSEKTGFIKGNAFKILRDIHAAGQKYDIIIIDPSSFMRTKHSLISASKGYKELNLMAMKTLSGQGILATFSCSHNMPNELFSRMLKEAAEEAGKKITILKRCHQAQDHPIIKAIPETEYLKGYFLKVETI